MSPTPQAGRAVRPDQFAEALARYLETERAIAQAGRDCTADLLALPVFQGAAFNIAEERN